MTAFDQFDPFEQRISAAIDEIASARRPDYLDDVFRQTARSSQRPRWTFPGRWLPIMDTTLSRVPAAGVPLRSLTIIAIVALLAAAAVAIVIAGSRPKVPSPVGPAVNGSVVYPFGGDLYIRDSIWDKAPGTPLLQQPGTQIAPFLSPDGETVAYIETRTDGDHLMAMGIDGSNQREVLSDPIEPGWSQASWALDSKHILMSGYFLDGRRKLYDARADGSGATELHFDGLVPWEGFWSPVDPDTFLLRAQGTTGVQSQGLYLSNAAGTKLTPLHLGGQSSFGPDYALSGASWAPDGKTIAYNSFRTDPDTFITGFRVHLVNPDGTNDRELPGPADIGIHQAWPAFSPDGTQILVQRFIFPTGTHSNDGAGWIAVVPADGSSIGRDIGTRIDNTQNPDTVKVWSPDGTLVMQWISATKKTYVVSPTTGSTTALLWPDDMPDWQRLAP